MRARAESMKYINEKISPINSISEEFGSTTTTTTTKGNSEEKNHQIAMFFSYHLITKVT